MSNGVLTRDVEPRNYFAVPGSGSDPGSRIRVRVRFRVRGSGFRGSGFGFTAQELLSNTIENVSKRDILIVGVYWNAKLCSSVDRKY